MKEPNLIVETFMSMFKWFIGALVVIVLIINAIWASVHYNYVNKSFGGSYDIAMTQDGENNNQSLTNGAAEDKDQNQRG